jgi:NAD(P)-dependent dehydrogenase (short-subunit alcohol dehydrogenase family)
MTAPPSPTAIPPITFAPDLLAGRVALVTGAARGIGRACVEALARAGAQVVLTDVDLAGALAEAQALLEQGLRVRARALDVRDESAWREAIAEILASEGRLDILVNNAGITGFEPYLGPQDPVGCSLETFRAVHATNLEGVFLGCKHAIPAMTRGGGSIINLSSRSGMVGIPAACAYASSKAAVRNHTKSVALHCAQAGLKIRCNSLHPATILTPMWEPVLGTGAEREATLTALAREVPLGRVGTPADVAPMVVFLASDLSGYITGAEFTIDGGILAGAAAAPKEPE